MYRYICDCKYIYVCVCVCVCVCKHTHCIYGERNKVKDHLTNPIKYSLGDNIVYIKS